jgi:NADPH:quinone reductase-like Zn-dependent oxidoreductase
MRSLVVFGPIKVATPARAFTLAGKAIKCAITKTAAPRFDPTDPIQASHALVRIRGFSVNYRDRAIILDIRARLRRSFAAIGSDFVGEVVSVGSAVTSIKPGDRVIGNAAYPNSGAPGIAGGVPSNCASREFQILHQVKLVKVPAAMSDEVAACFTIGAQTSFGMVRKLSLAKGDHVLVTAAGSNTSLFTVHALRRLPVHITVATTSRLRVEKLRALGVDDVLLVERSRPSFVNRRRVRRLLAKRGGFDAVIDPFFDLYLVPAVEVLRDGGRYITCGLYRQYAALKAPPPIDTIAVMLRAMFMNLQIIGNCVGSNTDLRAAIVAHAAGEFPVIIDSVFVNPGSDEAAFLDRSYNARDRFGKVAFLYR